MAVSAIQNNKNNSSTSYIGAAAIGIGTAYISRDLIPLTKAEKDDQYKASLREIKAKVSQSMLEEAEALAKSERKNKAAEAFIKIYEAGDKTTKYANIRKMFLEIKKLDKSLKNDVISIIDGIKDNARLLKREQERVLKAGIKDLRPIAPFVAFGAVVGLAIALVSNIKKKTSATKNN